MTANELLRTPLHHLDNKTRWTWVLLTGFLAAVCALLVIGRLYRKETERRQQAQELAKTREALIEVQQTEDYVIQELRRTAEHGYLALDEEGKVIRWNPGMENMTGKTLGQMLGQTLESVMDPKDFAAHHKAYIPWIQNPETDIKTLRLECRLLHTDGSRRPVYVTARKVVLKDVHPYALGLVDLRRDVVDLTKEKESDARGSGTSNN